MNTIHINKMWAPVTTLGYGNRLGIWVQGCNKKCNKCISPEMQSKDGGQLIEISQIIDYAKGRGIYLDGLTISGGEPFDQADSLLSLINAFKGCFSDDIVVFSGYTLSELQNSNSKHIHACLEAISVLVDGEYIDSQNSGIGLRGSDNQIIHVFNHHQRYSDVYNWERQVQCVFTNNHLWFIGIPP